MRPKPYYAKCNYLPKVIVWLIMACMITGCSDQQEIITNNPLGLTKVSIPLSVKLDTNESMSISGYGFMPADILTFTGESGEYTAKVNNVTSDRITYTLPADIPTGDYEINITRGAETMHLSKITIYRIYRGDVPDRDGMNLKGMVHCCGQPIPGVTVSDGINITTTDENGMYYMASDKKTGYVFISLPSGYKILTERTQPKFYAKLSDKIEQTDRNDFSLIKTATDKPYVMLALADMHLAARTYDREQYQSNVHPDINSLIAAYKAEGKEVWAVTLGDQSWDAYWYSNKFSLAEAIPYIDMIKCPVFHCMGNHDNDPNSTADWDATTMWRSLLGPTYYSFNIGNVHYVVLDNIIINGSQTYKYAIDAAQLNWMKKDLATLTDKTSPIVICMHAPLHSRPTSITNGNKDKLYINQGADIISAVSEFDNVTILSGHMHICYTGSQNDGKLHEYNTGAICATWWWTGRPDYPAKVHVCPDGAPGGYGVLEIDGKNVSHYYKSIGYARDYQFRSYDLNTVEITAEQFCPEADETRLNLVPTYARGFASAGNANEILVNVWGYGDGWSIEMSENGKPLDVTQVSEYDPLHIVGYEFQRMNAKANPTSGMVTIKNIHMFKATASSPSSTVDIKVTDRFGHVYTESMARPKPFTYSIK